MPLYALVIKNPAVARAKAIERQTAYERRKINMRGLTAFERARQERKLPAFVESIIGPPREVGDLHTICASECPDGMPNCRNCGDPRYLDACEAAGHCPYCMDKRHGVGPQCDVDDNGYELVELERPPIEAEEWSRTERRFVDRTSPPPVDPA